MTPTSQSMDIKRILTDYEAAKQQKADGRKQKMESECLRRQLNAEKVEVCLSETVAPVLDSVRDDLLKGGYRCDVERVSKKDSEFPKSERMFALCIRLKTDRDSASPHLNSALKFSADFGSLRVNIIAKVQGKEEKIRGPFTMSDLTSEFVEQKAEEFLKEVFTA